MKIQKIIVGSLLCFTVGANADIIVYTSSSANPVTESDGTESFEVKDALLLLTSPDSALAALTMCKPRVKISFPPVDRPMRQSLWAISLRPPRAV